MEDRFRDYAARMLLSPAPDVFVTYIYSISEIRFGASALNPKAQFTN